MPKKGMGSNGKGEGFPFSMDNIGTPPYLPFPPLTQNNLEIAPPLLQNTPLVQFEIRGKRYWVKRDDLLHPIFHGNKGRKFLSLITTPPEGAEELISFGSPLSNTIPSLGMIGRLRGWKVKFFVNYIPPPLKENPAGNYRLGVELGVKFIETGLRGEELRRWVLSKKGKGSLVIEEGGRSPFSKLGIYKLGEELLPFLKALRLNLFLPSGTGTTAFYLARFFEERGGKIKVFTTPTVGGETYLRRQWEWLEGLEGSPSPYPEILPPPLSGKFGKIRKEVWEMWQELEGRGIEWDLLYDPIGWMAVLNSGISDIVYLNQGGWTGNLTLLPRYLAKFGKSKS